MSSLSGSPPSRNLFGAVAIDLLPEVSPVFDRTEAILGEIFPHKPAFPRSLSKCVPHVSFLSGSVPSRHLFGAVAIYYRRSLQYSIVQKLFLGTYFPYTPAFHRSLRKCLPHMSSLSGLVRSRHLFDAVSNYYRRSLQYFALPPMSSLAGLLSPSYLSGRLFIAVFATRLTRMPAGCVTGVVQGR